MEYLSAGFDTPVVFFVWFTKIMLFATRFEFLFIISLTKNIKTYIFDTFSGILESFFPIKLRLLHRLF